MVSTALSIFNSRLVGNGQRIMRTSPPENPSGSVDFNGQSSCSSCSTCEGFPKSAARNLGRELEFGTYRTVRLSTSTHQGPCRSFRTRFRKILKLFACARLAYRQSSWFIHPYISAESRPRCTAGCGTSMWPLDSDPGEPIMQSTAAFWLVSASDKAFEVLAITKDVTRQKS
jgi:hypothetical protein